MKVKIEAGTQPEKVLRLRGKGLPDVNGYGRGDLLVRVHVWIPGKINLEERKLLERLQQLENFSESPKPGGKNFFERMKDIFD